VKIFSAEKARNIGGDAPRYFSGSEKRKSGKGDKIDKTRNLGGKKRAEESGWTFVGSAENHGEGPGETEI